ncbi:MAG: hypothetical protein ISR65_18215 [Bacteriovoracaceae bacterium]|nr:hypothetical protein [Bacteriovoracaceae bacterium]
MYNLINQPTPTFTVIDASSNVLSRSSYNDINNLLLFFYPLDFDDKSNSLIQDKTRNVYKNNQVNTAAKPALEAFGEAICLALRQCDQNISLTTLILSTFNELQQIINKYFKASIIFFQDVLYVGMAVIKRKNILVASRDFYLS